MQSFYIGGHSKAMEVVCSRFVLIPTLPCFSNLEGMGEPKAAQIPPFGCLRGLNSALVVLISACA